MRADRPDSRSADADHRAVAALMGQELEHVHRPRRLTGASSTTAEEHLQIERHRPQRVRPTPPRDELEIGVHERITQRVARPHPTATQTGPDTETGSSPNAPSTLRTRRGCPQDHPCIRRSRTRRPGIIPDVRGHLGAARSVPSEPSADVTGLMWSCRSQGCFVTCLRTPRLAALRPGAETLVRGGVELIALTSEACGELQPHSERVGESVLMRPRPPTQRRRVDEQAPESRPSRRELPSAPGGRRSRRRL